MIGFGTGIALAGIYDFQGLNLQCAVLVGWGGGIVAGTITSIILLIGPLVIAHDTTDEPLAHLSSGGQTCNHSEPQALE